MKSSEKKYKHLTLDERIEIMECLCKGMSFKAIAQRIAKDPTTVSKEIKLHGRSYESGFTKTKDTCPRLMKAPFVCNGCVKQNRSSCIYPRRKYSARAAQQKYETLLSSAREGVALLRETFYRTEEVISSAVQRGQHIYHAIMANHMPVSKSTVYRHIEKGYYAIDRIDLSRAVKFRQRAKKSSDFVPRALRVNRSYADHLQFMEDNPGLSCVEMDTVVGRIGGKAIMTFQFTSADFMFGILLDNKSSAEAAKRIIGLKHQLTSAGFSFGKVFPVLLTDNGGELSRVSDFDNDASGNKETFLFFCDANASYQKPHVENNHTLFRAIVPKGVSL